MEEAAYYDGDGSFIARTMTKRSPYGWVMGIDPPQVVGDENHERNAVFRTDTAERIGGLGPRAGQVKTEAGIGPLLRGSSSSLQEHPVNRFYVWRRVFELGGCLVESKLLFNHAF